MRFKFVIFLLAAVGFSAFAQQGEWYQGKPIKDIVFTGLRHIKAAELEGIMEPYKGKIFDDTVFWEIQGKLYALEYFERIDPSAVRADAFGNEVIIRFAVIERPIVTRIDFMGNAGLRRHELLGVVSIKVNDVVNQSKIRADEQAIINKYLEKGYPDIKIRSETQRINESSMALNFYVTEGEKISIQAFNFDGNTVFSARTLRGQLTLKSKNLINDGAFQEAKLLADIEAITTYYHDRGYIDAAILDVSRDITQDAKGNNNLILTFKINEGRIYSFGGITFEGNRIFSTEQLTKLINSKVGETVNSRRLEADFQRVADLYFENGYIFNTIGREENRDPQTGVISFRIPIVERSRAHIENIIVRGNVKTKTEVILREIPLEPGDVFSKTKVMDALRNLYNLQYFSMVAPDTPPGSADSLMDLVFTVEEQPTTDLQFGLTFSGSADPESFPISGLIKWNDRNLAGSGNQLGAEVNSSVVDSTSVSLNYTQRWIFGLPLSGGFDFTMQYAKRLAAMNNSGRYFNGDEAYAFPDGFNSYDEYNASSKLPPNEYLMNYKQWYFSLGFSTGYRWSTFLGNLTLSGGIRTGLIRNSYDSDLFRPFDPALRAENNLWTPKNSIWSSLTLDQRDIYFDPSRGYYGSERIGIYGIFNGEGEYYIRSDTKAEYYFTLFNIPITEKWSFKSVFGIHTGLSLISKQPGRNRDTPYPSILEANMLSVDGMFIGRGWSSEYRNKGLALWENWAELRFPIVPSILAWDFFFDAAGVETNYKEGRYFENFTIENMRFSYGFGIRFTLPQFPFRFSLAKRFRVLDGQFQWEPGLFGYDASNSAKGMDPVISFALSY
ncbi:outer membrane protein assembly factor BamA [Spirochaetia bacterium]|nr:outer membrane protein assembly factor BamA [Spirochaetia bacterium]